LTSFRVAWLSTVNRTASPLQINRLMLVLSGLAGRATHAAALMVKEIASELPFEQGQPSKVLWVPVKVEIKAGEPTSITGDIREVVHAEFVGEPRIWA